MAVYKFTLEGNFDERATQAMARLAPEKVLGVAVDYVQDDYLPALFYEHHGIPAWAPPKLRPGPPLVDSGDLATHWVSQITGDTAEIGSTTPYAHIHSEGKEIHATNASGLMWIPNPKVFGNSQRRVMTVADAIKKFGIFRPYLKGEKKGGKRQRRFIDKNGDVYFFGVASVKIDPRPIIAGIPNPIFEEGMGFTLRAVMEDAWAA